MPNTLFKAKRVSDEKWVQGDLIRYENGTFISNFIGETYQYQINLDTICQYIGKKDINGKKIFKGDIVIPNYVTPFGDMTNEIDEYRKGVVIYDAQRCQFLIQQFMDDRKNYISQVTVIGNIHD